MGKVMHPKLFSDIYSLSANAMKSAGVLDPILNLDTRLFIDPLLIEVSAHKEMSDGARRRYKAYFDALAKLLRASKREDDVPWRNAQSYLKFREIRGTCLGYGDGTTHGSGLGAKLTEHVLRTAKEIVDLGVDDPDFFALLALFERGIGPDRISDMVTNIILPDLVDFNARVLAELKVPTQSFDLLGAKVQLARNPCEEPPAPVILVPTDVLKELPIALDWDDVASCAAKNATLRQRVNRDVGAIWQAKTAKQKASFRRVVLSNKQAATTLLETIKAVKRSAYDLERDPNGLTRWLAAAQKAAGQNPLSLARPAAFTLDEVEKIVAAIVGQFKVLVEKKGLAKELWSGDRVRGEKSVQRLFFAVADTYCVANNLDITPEADSGAGPVDFKVASGYNERVLVEVKLSSNSRLIHGFTSQLDAYKMAEQTTRATYLVIDVGSLGDKDQHLIKTANDRRAKGLPVSELVIVDGVPKASGSRRKS